MIAETITIAKPDDWHVHLRDGPVLRAVAPYTARSFARAIIMPNLPDPVTTTAHAVAYRERIYAAVAGHGAFTPLMTCYLTPKTDPDDLARGFDENIFTAAKLYPAGATTHSARGVADLRGIYPVFERMEALGMPLLVHGEVTDPEVDIFDREAVFIDRVLSPLLRDFPALKVVLEHITTAQAVDFVRAQGPRVGATITVHHLMINRNALFKGGIRPHLYCLPIAKREQHRLALVEAATSGDACFFLGTDTAPHTVSAKEAACGCAGIFSAPAAIELYAQVFDEQNALDKFEAFAALNGARFYGLPLNDEILTLSREPWPMAEKIDVEREGVIAPFCAGETILWRQHGDMG
ncbi:dihydroorotase [Varunaivibrio sulfuroxidans]|nr:dihydroorotase [Varunaivibrio sulfuroxidans]WES30724.1 dihydroorotase [Varunaivibrio sulfuroxidans]